VVSAAKSDRLVFLFYMSSVGTARARRNHLRLLTAALLVATGATLESGIPGPDPPGSATAVTRVVDGVMVPDIAPLPTSVPIPPSNLNFQSKIDLGKQLFFDTRLSKNNKVSCAYCHIPGAGFSDPHPTSLGVDDQAGPRQAPTVLNAAFNRFLFWDGRAGSLEEQVLGPIQNPIEMGEVLDDLVAKLRTIAGYTRQFQHVFGTDVTTQGISHAIAAFERTLLSTNSAFDKYMMGDTKAMNAAAVRGMELFKKKRDVCSATMVPTSLTMTFII